MRKSNLLINLSQTQITVFAGFQFAIMVSLFLCSPLYSNFKFYDRFIVQDGHCYFVNLFLLSVQIPFY